jgi:hypothetical protein
MFMGVEVFIFRLKGRSGTLFCYPLISLGLRGIGFGSLWLFIHNQYESSLFFGGMAMFHGSSPLSVCVPRVINRSKKK